MLARAPMSRVELAPSYRASHVRPSSAGTMRGATAPTAGSAKCGSSRSSQPGPGTQSESRNATSGVSAAASPVFLAAPGPPFTGRLSTRAPVAAATRVIAPGSADPSSTTITRGSPASPARQRASSACRSRTGTTTVTSPRTQDPLTGGTGCAIPVSSRRRASALALGSSGTGVPDHQPDTIRAPWGVSLSTRTGEPPVRTVPPTSSREAGSGRRTSPAGASSPSGPGPGRPAGVSPSSGGGRTRPSAAVGSRSGGGLEGSPAAVNPPSGRGPNGPPGQGVLVTAAHRRAPADGHRNQAVRMIASGPGRNDGTGAGLGGRG